MAISSIGKPVVLNEESAKRLAEIMNKPPAEKRAVTAKRIKRYTAADFANIK